MKIATILALSAFLLPLLTFAAGIHLENSRDLADGEYKVCFIGDSGDGSLNQYMVASGVADEGCHQVRHLGDIIYSAGVKSAHSIKTYTRFRWPYRRIFKSKHKPQMYMSVGNHDYKKNPKAWIDLAKKHKNVTMPSLYYSDFWNDICFFTLDTMDKGPVQNKWFEARKAESKKNCKFTVAYGHHPYISSGRSAAKGESKKWYEKHIVGQVDMFLAGHDHHVAYEGAVSGTHFFVSGAGGHGLRPVSGTRAGGYAVEDFGYITLTFNRLESGQIESEYKIYTVKRRKSWYQLFKKGGVIRTLRHSGKLLGHGIR
ncbi:MAG: hypothetical protein HN509_15280 [Halobacteriovoraceae bacterium]|jgi:tartrate-resistant acid phosphatase type 5|nr:hypothetical protein [Halobacteriovoraceae bacterium]MBT5095416.1 hypothetical protein [Halobacteriovoraceae bacterium]